MSEKVKKYYDNKALQEWERLGTARGKIEFSSTMRLIKKYFPSSGNICDVGSGPGRYSVELMKNGYECTLVDLSQGLLDFAKMKMEEEQLTSNDVYCRDARDLSILENNSFDGVLLLGPMYHLSDKEDRSSVLNEVHRILKPGGKAIIAYLNSWGILKVGLTDNPNSYGDYTALQSLLSEKNHIGSESGNGFTDSYWTIPPVAFKELESKNFNVLTYAGCEGFTSGMKTQLEEISRINPVAYANILKFASETAELNQFRDSTEHTHFVVEK
jgi:SAM-dependent methyltransferase